MIFSICLILGLLAKMLNKQIVLDIKSGLFPLMSMQRIFHLPPCGHQGEQWTFIPLNYMINQEPKFTPPQFNINYYFRF